MSNLFNAMKNDMNYGYTENGAIKHNSTLDKVLDMFALGGSYRKRTDKEVEILFGDAYRQDKELALKCLFYLRDVRGGQGERRFFRVAYKWLCRNDEQVARMNLTIVPEFGRWDDLIDIIYSVRDTNSAIVDIGIGQIITQLSLDADCKTPSLLAKWMPSENASSAATKAKAGWLRRYMGYIPKEYRKMLSNIRKKLNILETLMSENRWEEIEFDKIPSVAGMKYRNAFAVKEVTAARYKAFMSNKETKVNASVLNPVDIADKVLSNCGWRGSLSQTEVDTLCKYWDNLKDYYQGREENAIAIIDVSGSMYGQPMAAAIGMGAYIAEKSHGPFANHFITFSSNPQLVEFEGDNIVDKIQRCSRADWGGSTNVEAAMMLILNSAIKNRLSQADLPKRLYIFSDMEFNHCMTFGEPVRDRWVFGAPQINSIDHVNTLFEVIEKRFADAGYEMPQVTFWNLDARHNNIPAIGPKFNYISGFSMSQMEAVMAGKTAVDMMLDVLNKERYAVIKVIGDFEAGAKSMACCDF